MKLEKYVDGMEFDFLNLLSVDLDGNLRSVTMPKSYVRRHDFRQKIGFDASNYGYAKVTDSDMITVPDKDSAFVEKREEFIILHMFGDVFTSAGELFDQYPRSVIRKTGDHLRSKGIADDAKMLVELEYYTFDSVEYACDAPLSFYSVASAEGIGDEYNTKPRFGLYGGYHKLPPEDLCMDFRNRCVSLMETVGIAVKYHHHEVAAGQMEIELDFMSLAHAADSVCLAKWIIKSLADEMNMKVTFMPKPIYKMPGSGMHVHQFLEKGGKSIFLGDELYGLSKEALFYTSGLLEHSLTGSLLAFSNPSTNSYRRLVPGFEAPVSATFAKASRSAAVRIPGYLEKDEVRIEYRTGDASANIYYMLSAMVLAGMDGIERMSDPVALGFNNPDVDPSRVFPLNLHSAMEGLKRDNEYLKPVFPQKLIDIWIEKKNAEALYVYNAPSPQEYELYF
ncbi:MAG: glutamine synthetase beta-grasp domain-containing protein [Synergistaceae bacterium]|nr:glutamine synthetase beta-grasp domain-containing protein [Synergistaceae bacterium]